MKRLLLNIMSVVAVLAVATSQADAFQYTITDLGAYGGQSDGFIDYMINDFGEIADDSPLVAFFGDNGQKTYICEGLVFNINNLKQIIINEYPKYEYTISDLSFMVGETNDERSVLWNNETIKYLNRDLDWEYSDVVIEVPYPEDTPMTASEVGFFWLAFFVVLIIILVALLLLLVAVAFGIWCCVENEEMKDGKRVKPRSVVRLLKLKQDLTAAYLRLKRHKRVSALMRLSPGDREFILSSDVPEASGSRNKFLVVPDDIS